MSSPRRASAGATGADETSQILRDGTALSAGLAIVERYERFIDYLYPVLQNVPRKHGVARDAVMESMFGEVELLITAAKSGQASRLYAADATLATLRFWLRFMVHPSRKLITPHQHRAAEVLLAEVGRMLGGWIKAVKGGGRTG